MPSIKIYKSILGEKMRRLVSFDWAMKKILRQKANFGILEGFLSELLKFDILIQEILESEANQETNEDKFNRVDLLAKNEKNELILIEVQHSSEIDYFHRMIYGASKLITEHIKKGEDYSKIKKVYSINIVYFALGQGRDYIYHSKNEFVGLNYPTDILQLSKNQKEKFAIESIADIYPEYYIIRVNSFNDIAKNSLDEWIYFLKNEEIKTNFKAKGLDKAKEALDMLKLDDIERSIYNRQEENKIYEASLLNSAKFEGKMEGKKEGKIEGKKETQIEIVQNMLKANMKIDTIAMITGLSIDEIDKFVED